MMFKFGQIIPKEIIKKLEQEAKKSSKMPYISFKLRRIEKQLEKEKDEKMIDSLVDEIFEEW